MTIEEKRRELFEPWVIEEANRRAYAHLSCVLKRDPIGGYATTWVDMAWLGFNAALDAVTILLPSPYPSVFYGAEEFADGIEECREFIKENNPLGLKVKP